MRYGIDGYFMEDATGDMHLSLTGRPAGVWLRWREYNE